MKPEIEFTAAASTELTRADPRVPGLDERILASSGRPGVNTRILQFAPDIDTSPAGSLTHDFWEEVYIVRGSLVDLRLDQEFTAGDFACRPPGMVHGPWRAGPDGCTTFEVRY